MNTTMISQVPSMVIVGLGFTVLVLYLNEKKERLEYLEKERLEYLEKERLEKERLEKECLEKERLEYLEKEHVDRAPRVDYAKQVLTLNEHKLLEDIKVAKRYLWELTKIDKRFMDIKKFVMASVKNYGISLKFASPDLQNDKEVVKMAIKENSAALQFASPALKKDKEIVAFAFKHSKNLCPPSSSDPYMRFKRGRWAALEEVKKDIPDYKPPQNVRELLELASPDIQNDEFFKRDVVDQEILLTPTNW